jgi:acyl-CoA dehydrogenase
MDPVLRLPWFGEAHRTHADRVAAFAARSIEPRAAQAERDDPARAGRAFLDALASEDLLAGLVPGGPAGVPDLRTLCLTREALAGASGLADSVFAVDGLGALPIALAGTDAQRREYLPGVARGAQVGAFALTEPGAGSDAAAIATTCRRDGDAYVLNGTKTLISNAGLATFYVVFAALPARDVRGRARLCSLIVPAGASGLRIDASIELLAPHPIGELTFTDCRVPAAGRLGEEGTGLATALATLDFFRPSVGAAACGMAARALREARAHARGRRQFGRALSEFQATQLALADMATDLEAARLLVYRAAWSRDAGAARITREGSMAKLFATEAAQRIVDRAVQIHGGRGVTRGTPVERLYREVRALRIYEGTSEIQRLVIARHVLRDEEN